MIIQAKTKIPHIRKTLVTRSRLIRKLNEGLRTKVTLLSAQAGYGKTTALSEWTKQCGVLVAWVSLDRLDNDWHPFWSFILASIRKQLPGFGESIGYLTEQESVSSSEMSMISLLNELEQIGEHLALIMDDFHLIDHPAILHALDYLLQHLPPHIHIYIASRSDLPIPTARLLAKGELLLVGMRDLKFDRNESYVFFRKTTELQLTNEQAEELFHQTEGWVSGLQLAAITLMQSDNVPASIREFSGRQRHIADYLLEEVFRYLPGELREFMLATSALSRMNGPLSGFVTGQPNSQAQLELLEQLNLFVIPLDEDRGWYRYHHLLSEFLQRLAAEQDPAGWRGIHLRAARWQEEHGFYEEAVEHYIQAEQVSDAVRLIETHLYDWMQSNLAALMRWISALPESSYGNKPLIEIMYISMLITVGQWNEAYRVAKQAESRYEGMREEWSEPEWRRTKGDLYYFCGITAYLQKDLPRASEYFERLDYYLPEGSLFQNLNGMRYQGYDYFNDLLSLTNELDSVEAFALKWMDRWKEKPVYPLVGFQYVTYCTLLYEWNRLQEAELIVQEAMRRSDLRASSWMQVQLHVFHSKNLQAKGRHDQAVDVLRQLTFTIDSPDRKLIERRLDAEQAEIRLRQGRLKESLDWLGRSGLKHDDEVSLFRLPEHLAAAKVLAAADRSDEAVVLLDHLYSLVHRENRWRDCIKIRITQSVNGWKSGREDMALAWLTDALELAEPAGYVRSFADEGTVMSEMLFKLLQPHMKDSLSTVSAGYINRLLEALEGHPLAEGLLTEQEMRVLHFIADDLMNKEIAKELAITTETVKFHIKNIYRKLGVNRRMQALARAKELGLL